ncbi:MAG: polyphosphate polymerase domain-containing protein [Chitinophagales bacterium]|nr:polyphosphate polymerase domain-containing protein [Chitinophagales bacterium]MBP8752976.1 polyphosphate polymerase domain-containing protein [Chitinophagales bacterium]MBP9188594.1 polyphosphate polymerase domain-containing protein [Chitinophagales bacterium]MBP9549240.1 polyphosphate polymerase domain-containing protein [Chitinophagales bacterium]MBP9704782.1 polyphosphate polymerase domain-containing protein [Chitinophagales bacterium]
MNNFQSILNQLQSITLPEMNAVELLDRKDTKFLFDINQLSGVLSDLIDNYFVLEINNIRLISYANLYFDTKDFQFYFQHHNGRLNRYKMRIRQYTDTGLCFFEIKFKTNTGRTVKKRMRLEKFEPVITSEIENFILKETPINPKTLIPNTEITFKRITLVEKNFQERATIDTGLILKNKDQEKKFETIAIAELKQNRTASGSIFREVMRNHYSRELRLSKYCIGLSYLHPELKQNHFKPKHLAIQKIEKNKLVYE